MVEGVSSTTFLGVIQAVFFTVVYIIGLVFSGIFIKHYYYNVIVVNRANAKYHAYTLNHTNVNEKNAKNDIKIANIDENDCKTDNIDDTFSIHKKINPIDSTNSR